MTNSIHIQLEALNKIVHCEDQYSVKTQIELVNIISSYPSGLSKLLEVLIQRHIKYQSTLSYIDGIIFKLLYSSKSINIKKQLAYYFNQGVVKLESSNNINYLPLYKCLMSNRLQQADILTQGYLQKLAGLTKPINRQWLYFTDIANLPIKDLQTIDNLWRIYSLGKFGFSIQREIWLQHNQNWDQLWKSIGWKVDNHLLRYPNEFIWDYTAPVGHLPLSNQLRGVQVLANLFKHPAWSSQITK